MNRRGLKFKMIASGNVLLMLLLFFSCMSQSPKDHDFEKVSQNHPGFQPLGSGDVVTQGFLDLQGNMWFSTTRDGVYRYDGTTFIHFTESDGLCSVTVNAIAQDKKGNIWFGTGNGLCIYDGKKFTHLALPEDKSKSAWLDDSYPIVNPAGVLSVMIDEDGLVWVGSNGAGVYSYDGTKFTSYLKDQGTRMPDGLYHNVITSIIQDAEGNIWFSSFSHGALTKFDGTNFTQFGVVDGLAGDMLSRNYLDRSGCLWFSSRSGGVSRYEEGKFITYKGEEGVCTTNMAVLMEDMKGNLWLGSFARSGMCMYENGGFIPLEKEGFEKLVDIKSISEDSEGNIWFGGRYGLLFMYDGTTLADFTNKGKS